MKLSRPSILNQGSVRRVSLQSEIVKTHYFFLYNIINITFSIFLNILYKLYINHFYTFNFATVKVKKTYFLDPYPLPMVFCLIVSIYLWGREINYYHINRIWLWLSPPHSSYLLFPNYTSEKRTNICCTLVFPLISSPRAMNVQSTIIYLISRLYNYISLLGLPTCFFPDNFR